VAARVGALDGLRAYAVAAVVVYHLEPAWLPSGFLGVDVFMVVSGFLITGLLLREFGETGRVRMGAFYMRRARRLLPAAMLCIAVVSVWAGALGPDALASSVREHGFAALLYATNWRLVADGVTYGGAVAGESPLVHLWSLAVEEQFYLAWPPVLVALLAVTRGRRWPVLMVAAAGATASAVWMGALYEPGADTARVYYGTDTRAQAFLLGAVAALVAPAVGRAAARRLSWLGVVAGVGVTATMATDEPPILYQGGFAAVALGVAVVCLAATRPGPVAACLDRAPLRALGRVSYGVYLWHWPAIVLCTPERVGIDGPALTATRLVVTGAGAGASWILVEQPVRRISLARFTAAGAASLSCAAVVLALLPAPAVVAFADYRTDELPRPVVQAPTREPRRVASALTDSPRSALALPAGGTAMLVGDSGMLSASPAMSAGLRHAGWEVVETAYPGMGLTQPEDAVDRWADAARGYGVDLAIVMIGGWDVGWVHSHGEGAYATRIDAAVAAFTAAGGKVLWLSVLPGGDDDDRELEHVFAAAADRHRGVVEYLDVERALRAPEGGWPPVVDGRRLRGPDGWHLCPDGAAAVAHFVLGHLGLDGPGWDDGPWRADPGYHDPPGLCAVQNDPSP